MNSSLAASRTAPGPRISLEGLTFRYRPFPLGLARPVMEDAAYAELAETFPAPQLFAREGHLGERYSLSPVQNGDRFRAFLKGTPPWRAFVEEVTSDAFLGRLLDALAERRVDLGARSGDLARGWRLRRFAAGLRRGYLLGGARPYRVQVVFTMLPADGGCLLPHTDGPSKDLNVVLPMIRPGEWKTEMGGFTALHVPKDESRTFSRTNLRLAEDEVETVATVPFEPNQALFVVRSYNSWHSVPTMKNPGSPALRKAVNVNLVRNNLLSP